MGTVDIRTFTIQFDVVYRLQDLAARPPIVVVTMTTLYTFVCNYFDIITSSSLFFLFRIQRESLEIGRSNVSLKCQDLERYAEYASSGDIL